jgi:hypothetical protein
MTCTKGRNNGQRQGIEEKEEAARQAGDRGRAEGREALSGVRQGPEGLWLHGGAAIKIHNWLCREDLDSARVSIPR